MSASVIPPANFTILLNSHAGAFPPWSGRLTVPVRMKMVWLPKY